MWVWYKLSRSRAGGAPSLPVVIVISQARPVHRDPIHTYRTPIPSYRTWISGSPKTVSHAASCCLLVGLRKVPSIRPHRTNTRTACIPFSQRLLGCWRTPPSSSIINIYESNHPARVISSPNPSQARRRALRPASSVANLCGQVNHVEENVMVGPGRKNLPQTLIQLPPPTFAALRLRRAGAGQAWRVWRTRQQPPAERKDHPRDKCVLRSHVLRALRLGLGLSLSLLLLLLLLWLLLLLLLLLLRRRLQRLLWLLLLLPRQLSSCLPRGKTWRTMRRPRPIIARARRNLSPIRIVPRVVRMCFGAHTRICIRTQSRMVMGMGLCGASAARQRPDLRRGKRAAPMAAVVSRGPKSTPAAHALHAVVRTEMVVVVMMMMMVRGGGGHGGGGRGSHGCWGCRPPRGLEVLARWDRERRGAVGAPVGYEQRVGRRETREGEQEGARCAGVRGRLCLGVVSIEEENVGMWDELPE